ncbi:hypothetical protein CPC08DRAFT_821877 [Agrocybe pediades]|nr:hypothetical protein CPC08DRAFT_821877 [Agrocybe pediades]
MLQHPHFLETRPWTLKTLQPFDRKAYIDALLSQYPAVPHEFRLWIMEWPARMVPFGMWPSSPFTFHWASTLEEDYGLNWLAYLPDGSPSLLKILHRYPSESGSHEDHWIPALLFWKLPHRASWLIFKKDEPDLFGRVMNIDDASGDPPLVCRLPLTADRKHQCFQMYRDWIQFLQDTWYQQLAILLKYSDYYFGRQDEPLSYPVAYGLGKWAATTLPSLPWVSIDDPAVLAEVQGHLHN